MRTTDILDQLYNPTSDFLVSQYPWVSSLEMGGISAGGGAYNTGGGGGNISIVPAVEPPFYVSPIITPELPISYTPKVNIKLSGLINGFVTYDNKSYFDGSTIELNVLTTMDRIILKGEGADYSDYYVISYEYVSEPTPTPVKDIVPIGGVNNGGAGRNRGPVYSGGQYNPGSPGFNSNLTERPIDQNAQK